MNSELDNCSSSHPWLHRIAVLTAFCTFPLIFMGGLVTSHQAGMSVPDWPNSYGYNMFLFPPRLWIGGIFYEHTHRLMGTLVGFCATILTLIAWGPARTESSRRRIVGVFLVLTAINAIGTSVMALFPAMFHLSGAAAAPSNVIAQGAVGGLGVALCSIAAWFCRTPEPRRWVRWLATACLMAICIQGLLGGLRVDLINLPLAMVHGCFAQASFCLIIGTCIVISRWWQTAPDLSRGDDAAAGRRLVAIAVACVVIVFCQLIIGATMRHLQAGLAIPGVLVYGHFLPPTDSTSLAAANHLRIWKMGFDDTVTLGQIWLHFGHRLGAVIVTIAVMTLHFVAIRNDRNGRGLRGPAIVLACLLLVQITLGILTVYLRKPADVASSHVAVGALVLATTFLIAVRSMRLYSIKYRIARDRHISREETLASSISPGLWPG